MPFSPLRLPLHLSPPCMFFRLALSRAQTALSCFLLRSHPPYSRFIFFFHHPPLHRTRTVMNVSLSLSPSLFLPLSVSVSPLLSPTVPCPYDEECRQRSNRSLAFARTASLLHPSVVREPAPPLPLPSPPSPPPPPPSSTFLLATLSTLLSDLLYHIRHQHYTRALISSVGNSAFLAISLLLYHPLAPSPTLSPRTLSPPRALLRFLRLSIPTRPTYRIVYALRSSTRLGYGCLISLCRTQDARIH